ncbi:MAG: hypothetical protein FOGNACKC_01998 [Anaerolineae bacterium]|nr:hypothetical protein [Anaerolineae bacterium]
MPGLNRNETYRLPVVIPSDGALEEFNKFVTLWFEQIETNTQESRKLAEIRDYLLPRLLGGEIEV